MISAIGRVYLFNFLNGFVPIMQLYTLLFAAQDLSTLQISILLAAWSIAALAFEVPSGVLADKIDRRIVLGASQMFTAAAFVVWLIEPGFWGFFIGFVLWGFGGALESGTFEALVYDELADNGQTERFATVLGRTEATYLIGIVGGSAYAAVFAHRGYDHLLVSSLVVALASALIARTLPKAKPREEVEDDAYFSMLKRGVRSAVRVPVIARLVAIVALSGAVTDVISEWAPLFSADRSVQAGGVALIGALSVLVMAAASGWATRLPTSKLPETMQLAVAGGLVVAATAVPMWPAIVLFNLAAALANATAVLARAAMQHHVQGDIRATTTSVAGFLQEVVNVVALVAVGVLASAFDRTDAFRAAGVAVVITAAFLLVSSRLRKS